jgi:signal transduction protein with GAF and PtsI domain
MDEQAAMQAALTEMAAQTAAWLSKGEWKGKATFTQVTPNGMHQTLLLKTSSAPGISLCKLLSKKCCFYAENLAPGR